jgi:SAM-dependent methyltransferase
MKISPNRPEAILSDLDVVAYKKQMKAAYAVEALEEGYYVLVLDYFSSGLEIVNELKRYLQQKYPQKTHQQQLEYRKNYRDLSHRILMEVSLHRMRVKKAPTIGWIKILYPDLNDFLLSFPDIQGLNSAWQWYVNGVKIPVLQKPLHPWYGTYFPTRFEHLELFDAYLKNDTAKKNLAIDVGVGSGVLSLQMLQQGFVKVIGTDSNPNAIIGMQNLVKEEDLQERLQLYYGDLFVNCEDKADLIVFNPPWLPLPREVKGIEQAMYYGHDLFPRFFEQAIQHLNPDGELVLLFSNLAQITQSANSHPIEEELAHAHRFTKVAVDKKGVRKASAKTKRNLRRRAEEQVELWVLKPQ